MKRVTLAVLLGILVCLTAAGQAVAIPENHPYSVTKPQITSHNMMRDSAAVHVETARIISVLERRIKDPKVLARTRKKLFTLHAREIRLLSSLCDRITSQKHTTRSDVLFSLFTTLIVFS